MESLQTSGDPESNPSADADSTEPANGAEVGSPSAQASDPETEPREETEPGQETESGTEARGCEAKTGEAEEQVTPDAAVLDGVVKNVVGRESGGRGAVEVQGGEVERQTDGESGETANSGDSDGPSATAATTDTSAPINTVDGTADASAGTDGAAVAESPPAPSTVSAPVAPPPLGPYMDLETQSVVVRSEPLVSLYYNPQSSTAGQISVESPHSQSGPAQQPETEPCRTTYAER